MSFSRVSKASALACVASLLVAASCTDATKSSSPATSAESAAYLLPNGTFNRALVTDAPIAEQVPTGPAPSFSVAGGTDVVTNGTFAAGLSGWTAAASSTCGAWQTYSGSTSPRSGMSVAAPASAPAAILDMNCGAWYSLYQTVTVPASGQLSFDLYLANRYGSYVNGTVSACCTQMFRADITTTSAALNDIGAGVLKNVYATKPGDALVTGYNHITADLTSLAGQTVRIRFIAGVWDFYFQIGLDNVSLVGATNNAPTVSLPASVSATEGQAVTVTATAGDVDGDALTYKWDINNDGAVDSVTTTPSISLTFADQGSHVVGVSVDDGHGGTASATTTVSVANAAPAIASINSATSIPVGGTFNLAATFADAGAQDAPWTAIVDWGDQSSSTISLATQGAITAAHVYSTFGTFTVTVTVKDKDGASSAPKTVAITTTDVTPPVIGSSVVGTLGTNGWFTSDVNVSWTTADPESGVSTKNGCDAVTVSTNTPVQGTTFTCTATNGAGLSSSKSVTVLRDATKPVVTFSGAAATYTVDQTINITCSASDALSGLASTTCANVTGPAYDYLGTNTRTATATDKAGNVGSATVTFTVVFSGVSGCQSMYPLINRFVTGAKWSKQLTGRMDNVCDKVGKDIPSKDEQVGEFLKELGRAQDDGAVSAANAAVLSRLIKLL